MRSSLVTDRALTRSASHFAHETSITGYVIDRHGGSITHSFAYRYALPMVRHESRAPEKVTNVIILGNRRTHVLAVQLCILLNSVVFNM
jgi:hypothetical protein